MKKIIVIIIVSVALLFTGYLLYRYFFYTCCAPPPQSVLTDSQSNDSVLNDPDLLYAKRATIGLCRTKSGSGGSCHFNTYLYKSGKLIIESGELAVMEESGGEKATAYPAIQKELDKSLMDKITRQIRDSIIMNKSCKLDMAAAQMVSDLYISYFVNLDGIKKRVRFPVCESEFNAIDKLIDAAV
ncbi:MAG: hypothetical protein AAB797_01320 [Patescibacteria group bacterium]